MQDNNGTLAFGTPTAPDSSYIWVIEQQSNGTKLIKNMKTSKYLTMAEFNSATSSLSTAALSSDDKFQWNFEIAIQTEITSASSSYKGYGLQATTQTPATLQCVNLTGASAAPQMKWNFTPAAKVPNVVGPLVLANKVYNLRNSWTSMYLIEQNGVPVYGNADPSDPDAQWEVVFDPTTKLTALINKGTGDYVHAGNGPNGLVCDSTKTYYWNLLRNQNDLYPDAVVFQDSKDSTKFMHMESMNGYIEDSNAVQPSWGTPHWEPIAYTASSKVSSKTAAKVTVPTGYFRMQSKSNPGTYLESNPAGTVTYDKVDASNPYSHWELVKSKKSGLYYLENRQTGQYIVNMGNGVLKGFAPSDATLEGSLWKITSGTDSGTIMLSNDYAAIQSFQQPYLNIHAESGLAQSSLVSVTDPTAEWISEKAPSTVTSISENANQIIPMTTYSDTNVYTIIYQGKTQSGTYKLEYSGNNVLVVNTSNGKYLYYQSGLKSKSTGNTYDTAIQWTASSKLGANYLSSGKATIQLEVAASSAVYDASDAQNIGGNLLFTVFAQQSGTEDVQIGAKSSSSATIAVNGISQVKVSLPVSSLKLNLEQGINTITVTGATGVTNLTILNSVNKAYRGASTDYQSYEAEDCSTNGTLISSDTTYKTIASESSGRSAVELENTEDYISFTLTKPTDAMTIRYSIPDTADGKGQNATLDMYVNGSMLSAIPMSSTQSWLYGAYPWTNNPGDGSGHDFYDEVNFMLDKTYPAGTVIKFQVGADNYAANYVMDVIETELVSSANVQPANSLSITSYGAIANDGKDDTSAFTACIAAAAQQGKEVWIPQGSFDVNQMVDVPANVVIRGAGMWYSTLNGTTFTVQGSNVGFYDFSMRGTANTRRDSIDHAAIEDSGNIENLTAQNLWIQHYKVGMWLGSVNNLHLVGNRIRDTYADGINLDGGCDNALIAQNDIRSTGDDGIALWSQTSDSNDVITDNTVRSPWLANCIALYGGTNDTVSDNIVENSINASAGINISTNFNPQAFAGTINVARNTLISCGSKNSNLSVGAIWFNTVVGYDNHANVNVDDNLVLNSVYQGVSFSGSGTVDHVQMTGNVIANSGTYGVEIGSDASGAMVAKNNLVYGSAITSVNNNAKNAFALSWIEEYLPASIWTPTLITIVAFCGAISLFGIAVLVLILLMELGIIEKNKKLKILLPVVSTIENFINK